jgi:hypothetical protein
MRVQHRILGLAVALLITSGQTSAQNPTMKSIMREKLTRSQQLLEAVVGADFAAIGRSADALSRITETEIVSWQLAAQPEYAKQATFFVLSVRGLQEAASSRNLDKAIFEYTTLVASCARCHAHARRLKTVSFEPPAL